MGVAPSVEGVVIRLRKEVKIEQSLTIWYQNEGKSNRGGGENEKN
jgi:hypothetical protein